MYMCKYHLLIIQVEAHVYLQQDELLSVCNELNIVMTAFAPLTSPVTSSKILSPAASVDVVTV
mgnify:CR=1 FL=1